MPAEWKSNIPAVQARLALGIDRGLIAAAEVVRQTVSSELRLGYTTGEWVTPHVALTVTYGSPENQGTVRVIRVGTNVMYALYWEVGFHMRLWVWRTPDGRWHSRPGPTKFMRREIWVPALNATRFLQAAEFTKQVKRALEAA